MNDAAREALAGLFIRHANRWCRTCGQRGELCHNPHTGERIAIHRRDRDGEGRPEVMNDQALVDALAEDLDQGDWREAWKRARRLADTCDRAGVLRRDLAVRDLLVAIAGLAAALDEAGVELEESPDELDDDDDDAEGL